MAAKPITDFKEFRLLVEVQGPFVSTGVLRDTFPQGFPKEETLGDDLRRLRLAYKSWSEAPVFDLAAHQVWLRFVLTDVLEFEPSLLATGQAIPQSLRVALPALRADVTPDLLITTQPEEDLLGNTGEAQPLIPVFFYSREQKLEKPLAAEHSARLSPVDRAITFLRGSSFSIALLSNGEQWIVVHAPAQDAGSNSVTSTATWYAEMWLEEPVTLRAFRALTGARCWFASAVESTLPKLLERSALNQGAVTKQLGRQVRQAVELLILALDRADQDRNRGLLAGVSEATLYEAAISVMMRLVFLFFAEERELLPASDLLYASAYAVSTIRDQLQADADRFGPEVLERRHDAWSRLLAAFRAVHAGLGHDRLTLPAYGGQLFDPDRFCFLEGRSEGTSWKDTPAAPLPVDNRTVLYALEALQILHERGSEPRQLTFRELDVPDIGHVYESLLDHTAKRASEITLGLVGSEGEEEEAQVARLEEWRAAGDERLLSELKELTGKSVKSLGNLLAEKVDSRLRDRLRTACQGDSTRLDRVLPYANLVRNDPWGHPVVILPGSVFVTQGADRRSTGTHYTPTSLTEPIVQYTLEPVVYEGPAEGVAREQWRLKSPAELLKLKVCDMACGSGAFLVAAARYLSKRLQEAWAEMGALEAGAPRRSPEGIESTGAFDEDLIPLDAEERETYALRVIVQRCIYGVDKNPLAAEMAKLSLWLLTLAKGKPFTFVDHAINCGDSLIGASREQLEAFDLDETGHRAFGFGPTLDRLSDTRRKLAMVRAETVADVERQSRMLAEAERQTEALRWIGDALIGMDLKGVEEGERVPVGAELGLALQHDDFAMVRSVTARYRNGPRPFHWNLEFPEAFEDRGGFDAIVGNPPFIGGQKITGVMGRPYREFLVERLASGQRGSADYSAYFFLRARTLLQDGGCFGLLATNTIAQGDTREVGLDQVVSDSTIMRAIPSLPWPGEASLEVAYVWIRRGAWAGPFVLDGAETGGITPLLTPPGMAVGNPNRLRANQGKSFQGSIVLGMGFVLAPEKAQELIAKDVRNADVLFPYLNGEDLNSRPDQSASRWVINFHDWPLDKAEQYSDCMRIVRETVKPERDMNPRKVRRERWWQFAERQPALQAAIAGLDRVLVLSRVSKYFSIASLQTGFVFNERLTVIVSSRWSDFAFLQSTHHEQWALKYGSTLETRPMYTPSECFETYPLLDESQAVDTIGERYYSARSRAMHERNVGLTEIYNLFHSDSQASDVREFRNLHIEMDRAVAAAYGWTFDLGHGFHETKQGVRFTISPQARTRVLDLLLALNHERYAAYQQAEEAAPKRKAPKKKSKAAAEPSLLEHL
jgi:hypothetical protein